jgi:hypothetical protein
MNKTSQAQKEKYEYGIKKNNPIFVGILIFLLIMSFFLFSYILISKYVYGDYKIDSFWINSSYEGKEYCDNCLWIRFDEGCNRYKTFYFETQHELDKRLEIGMPVDIYFNKDKGTIKYVAPRLKYNYKCS